MPTFDLALVMAGAVSAGAYTGGAMDYLLQALDAWTASKQSGYADHRVNIKTMTGASAGGITAGVLATALREAIPPISDPTDSRGQNSRNKFYDTWVKRIHIDRLLETRDLRRQPNDSVDPPVFSLLDSTVLEEIAEALFVGEHGPVPPRPYIADPVTVALTLTNLRGVPYQLEFQGLDGRAMPYVMTSHADQITFAVGPPPVVPPGLAMDAAPTATIDALPLDPTNLRQAEWATMRMAALATAAFPFGLRPRAMRQKARSYNLRQWFFPHTRVNDRHQTEFGFFQAIPTAMNVKDDFDYDFLCVDGGAMDNEPVGLARFHLTEDRKSDEHYHSTEGTKTQSALLMIDPFPDAKPFDENYKPFEKFSLLGLTPSLLGAFVNQARFKPAELTRARDPEVFNQFLVSPSRRGEDGAPAIACGGLSGFSGFLSLKFRQHDFQLGRRNMQQFLRKHFVLPDTNNLFSEWSPKAKEDYRIEYAGKGYLPIIPVSRESQWDEPVLPWPEYTAAEFQTLQNGIRKRSEAVVQRSLQKVDGFSRYLLRAVWLLKRKGWIRDFVLNAVLKDLADRRQAAADLPKPRA